MLGRLLGLFNLNLFPQNNIEKMKLGINKKTVPVKSGRLKIFKIKGLIEMRADMMVISMLLINFIVKNFDVHKIRVSDYSLKEGVISKKLGLKVA